MLSNTLRLNLCYLKIFQILHTRYHPKIIAHILKNKQKNKCVCIQEIIELIKIKMKMKMKNRSHRYDVNRPRSKHKHKLSKQKLCLTIWCLYILSNTKATFEGETQVLLLKKQVAAMGWMSDAVNKDVKYKTCS